MLSILFIPLMALATKPMRFRLPVTSQAALAIASLHGAVDIVEPRTLPFYAAVLLLPAPPAIVTGLFIAASVVHFAMDIGWLGSLGLHTSLAVTYGVCGTRAAVAILLAYMLAVHVPMLVIRLWSNQKWRQLSVLLACATASLLRPRTVVRLAFGALPPNQFIFTHTHQKIVVAHVLSHARDLPRLFLTNP
jgi:hypothetical protein